MATITTKFLSKAGLTYFFGKLKDLFVKNASDDPSNEILIGDDQVNMHYVKNDAIKMVNNGQSITVGSQTDGVTIKYTSSDLSFGSESQVNKIAVGASSVGISIGNTTLILNSTNIAKLNAYLASAAAPSV